MYFFYIFNLEKKGNYYYQNQFIINQPTHLTFRKFFIFTKKYYSNDNNYLGFGLNNGILTTDKQFNIINIEKNIHSFLLSSCDIFVVKDDEIGDRLLVSSGSIDKSLCVHKVVGLVRSFDSFYLFFFFLLLFFIFKFLFI
jgi:hypothetical protein